MAQGTRRRDIEGVKVTERRYGHFLEDERAGSR